MADEKKPEKQPTIQELQADMARLQADVARLTAMLVAARAGSKPVEVQRQKESGAFVSTRYHYRMGRYYSPGEVIHIKDEVPGKTWTRVEQAKPQLEPKPSAASLRPSDRDA